MSTPKVMAMITLSPAFLREILQLPDGAEVTGVSDVIHGREVVYLRIEGAGWPVEEGQAIPPAKCLISERRTPEGEKLWPEIKWDFQFPMRIVNPAKPA